ncbi:class C sortase [Corynebacterium sp. H130]|uniref:class C sortase n=1 Tax=Corynebacterium sp. H130 TaxID=3133444 RepID=UPI0030AE9D33
MSVTKKSKSNGQGASRSKKRRSWLWLMLGALLLLYPIVATLWNNHLIEQRARDYSTQVKDIEPREEILRLRREAHEYNAWLEAQGHHAMPPEESSPGFDRYMKTLAPPETKGTIGRITIESIGVDLPIAHSTRPQVLYQGAGHMFGSDLPVGGKGNNAVITAHTGMVNASMFDQLPAVKNGAIVKIQVLDETLYYKVTGRKVVKPNEWQDVTYEHGRDKLTLITCTPYGLNTDRLLVEAERIEPPFEDPGAHWKLPLSWWMILDLLILLLVFLFVILGERRRRRRKRQESSDRDSKALPTGDSVGA